MYSLTKHDSVYQYSILYFEVLNVLLLFLNVLWQIYFYFIIQMYHKWIYRGKFSMGKIISWLKPLIVFMLVIAVIVSLFFLTFSVLSVESLLLHYIYCCELLKLEKILFYTYFGVILSFSEIFNSFCLQMSGTNFNGLSAIFFKILI